MTTVVRTLLFCNTKFFFYIALILFDYTVYPEELHEIIKRSAQTALDHALQLYYYPNKVSIPKLIVNISSKKVCGADGFQGGFYLPDIIGEVDVETTQNQCLAACMNYKSCLAVNYLSTLRKCILLRSGTAFSDQLYIENNSEWTHLLFDNCASKPKNVKTKLPSGSPTDSCGAPFFEPTVLKGSVGKIIGGDEASPYSFPWIGYLVYELDETSILFCGCSLIKTTSSVETRLAITAAHCVTDENLVMRDLSKFRVTFGNHDIRFVEAHEQTVSISKMKIHSKWNSDTLRNDVAIIKFNTSVKFNNFVRPVCLASPGELPKDMKNCSVAGWGRIYDETYELPARLQQLRLSINNNSTCKSGTVWGSTYDSNSMLCAGPLDGKANICEGDSGGPLACMGTGNHWTLFGISSFVSSFKCAQFNKPGVFACIACLRSFIDQAIIELNK